MSDEKATTETKKMPDPKSTETMNKTSEKGFIPTKYTTQELIKESGKPKLEEDKKTGIVYKTFKLTNPLVPEGETVASGYDTVYHKVGFLAGKRVSYTILKSDQSSVIGTKPVGSVDR